MLARVPSERLFRVLLVGVHSGETLVTGNLAKFIEMYYVFSFEPRTPLLRMYFREIPV